MPNWKTYESSVRLLAAIVAAHPELKLNYAGMCKHVSLIFSSKYRECFTLSRYTSLLLIVYSEIGKLYGDKTTYKAAWGRMKEVETHGRMLRAALHAGLDPITVDLEAAPAAYGKGIRSRRVVFIHFLFQFCPITYLIPLFASVSALVTVLISVSDISDRFGGDSTTSAIENRFRRIKTDAKLVNIAVNKGQDPIILNIGGENGHTPMKGGASGGQNAFLYFCSLATAHFPIKTDNYQKSASVLALIAPLVVLAFNSEPSSKMQSALLRARMLEVILTA